MTAPKHTPGPWKSVYRNGMAAAQYGHNVSCDMHSGPGMVAGCDSIAEVRGHDDDEAKANARLIAAAPDLLAACERFIRAQDENDRNGLTSAAMLASAAIAKARGEA